MTNCNEFFFLPCFSCRSSEASQNINLYGCMAFFLALIRDASTRNAAPGVHVFQALLHERQRQIVPFSIGGFSFAQSTRNTCWRRLDHRAHLLHQPLQATFHPWQAQHAPKVALCSICLLTEPSTPELETSPSSAQDQATLLKRTCYPLRQGGRKRRPLTTSYRLGILRRFFLR